MGGYVNIYKADQSGTCGVCLSKQLSINRPYLRLPVLVATTVLMTTVVLVATVVAETVRVEVRCPNLLLAILQHVLVLGELLVLLGLDALGLVPQSVGVLLLQPLDGLLLLPLQVLHLLVILPLLTLAGSHRESSIISSSLAAKSATFKIKFTLHHLHDLA